MQEENLDRIETVICDSEQLAMSSSRTGTKAKNFRGSVVSDGGGSSVSLLKGAAFGIHHEFMQFKNSLLEGKANLETKQKRKRYVIMSHAVGQKILKSPGQKTRETK